VKQHSKILFIVVLAAVIFVSCRKKPKYPDTPVITFKSFQVYNNGEGARLTVEFTDGNGDIGLKQGDTLSPYSSDSKYYYNLFLEYYEQVNGEMKRIELMLPFYYRTPFIEQEGKDKSMKGEIAVDIVPFYYDVFSPRDTFEYSIQFVDRALNESNIVYTGKMLKP
jgi:hypothetical protein